MGNRARGADEELRKLFIGGLNRNVTEEGFVEYFGQWGNMSDSVIIKDNNGQSKGFGFVTYETVEQTDDCIAVKKDKGHQLGGKDIEVKRAIPRDMSQDPEQTQKNTRMFIGGLGQDLNEDQIKSYFEDNFSCTVEVVDLIMEKKDSVPEGQQPRRRGFGFITFDDCDIVDKLCIMKTHEIGGRSVNVKKAAPRGAAAQGREGSADRGYGGRGQRNDGYGGGQSGGYGRNQNSGYGGGNQSGYGGGNRYGGNQDSGYGGGYGGNQGSGYGGGYGGNQGGGYGGNQGGGYGGNQGGGYGGGYGGNQDSGYGGGQGGGYGGGGYGKQNNGGGPQRSRGRGRGGYRPY